MPNAITSEQARIAARTRLENAGKTVQEWAVENDLHPSTVYAVLSGQKKCLRGEAHRAAVLLGIKAAVVAQ